NVWGSARIGRIGRIWRIADSAWLETEDSFAFWISGAAPELLAGVLASFGGPENHRLGAPGTRRNATGRMWQCRRVRSIGIALALAFCEACGGKLLAVAALGDEGFLKGGDLLIEQVIGLVDEAKGWRWHGLRGLRGRASGSRVNSAPD